MLTRKRVTMSTLERGILCAFCGKSQQDANKIISSPAGRSHIVYICDECVDVCAKIIEKDAPRESKRFFGVETRDLERMESMGFITVNEIQGLSGSVVDFLLQMWNMIASAKRKLDETDKTELGKQIAKISTEISEEGQSLESKKAELERLKKKFTKISKNNET